MQVICDNPEMASVLHLLNAGTTAFTYRILDEECAQGEGDPTHTLGHCWMTAALPPRYGLVRFSRAYDDMMTTITAEL
jgi:hypothetical protein